MVGKSLHHDKNNSTQRHSLRYSIYSQLFPSTTPDVTIIKKTTLNIPTYQIESNFHRTPNV